MWIDRESHTIKTDKMKKAGLILILVTTIFLNGHSQNFDDALRYSQIFYSGTARFMSMGGAFTALGGDLSAIGLNPAGTGVFRLFEFSLTPHMFYNNTSSLYNKTSSSDFRYSFNLGQIGVVSNIISTGNETGLVSLNAAYSFNKTNNFNENNSIHGISDSSSMADYWVNIANGNTKMDIPNDSWAAYKTWLIDTLSGSNTLYGTIFSYYGDSAYTYGQTVTRTIENGGYTGEHSFSIGANYSNKFYFGATLGISSLKYTGHYQHNEAAIENVIYDFKNFTYTDHFDASGTGFSLKIGTIIRPAEYLRIGFALHSPVVYRINESFFNNITAAYIISNPDPYFNTTNRYKYTFTTPFRANAGVALQIFKLGIISADYEFVDYRMARFSRAIDDENFDKENTGIKKNLLSTSNLRLGAELRLSNIYLRGGYSYYGKPLKADDVNKNLNYNVLSFGIGMRQQNFYFDLAFTALSYSSKSYMYYDPPFLQPVTIDTKKSTFAATMRFKF